MVKLGQQIKTIRIKYNSYRMSMHTPSINSKYYTIFTNTCKDMIRVRSIDGGHKVAKQYKLSP